jgi:uncharacterized protein
MDHARPFPGEIHPLFRDFVDAQGAGRLVVRRCTGCEHVQWPPREFCGRCRGTEFTPHEVEPSGVVYTFTVVHRAFHPWFADRVPYGVAVVELGDGIRLTGLFEPVDQLACGVAVRGQVDADGLMWTPR